MTRTVGVIGLGTMGSAFARNLAASGFAVVGCDVDAARAARLAGSGVEIVSAPADVGRRADVLVTSLPSVAALEDVVAGLETVDGHGRVVAEAGTLPVTAKQSAAARLGVTPATPGVFAVGSSTGLGQKAVDVWIGPCQSFVIGDESIKIRGVDHVVAAELFLRLGIGAVQHLRFTVAGAHRGRVAGRP